MTKANRRLITFLDIQIEYVPFHDLLEKAAMPGTLKDKVVILGYDGERIDRFETPAGKVKAHRLFVYGLDALYRKAKP